MIELTAIIDWCSINIPIVLVVLAVILLLKGLALYRAARKESVIWFWVILIFNTLGVLPLLYLIFSKAER